MEIQAGDLNTMLASVLCGALLGLEREYQNKSAGLRTIVLICLGSTIFTMISQRIGGSDDRVAANIITGIGFIGAGVIFKENYNVKGLTTAAVIWIAAAIGMVIGMEDYSLAFVLSFIVLVILNGFGRLENLIDTINHKRTYKITFVDDKQEHINRITQVVESEKLRASQTHMWKANHHLTISLEVSGNKKYFRVLTEKLVLIPEIQEIEH